MTLDPLSAKSTLEIIVQSCRIYPILQPQYTNVTVTKKYHEMQTPTISNQCLKSLTQLLKVFLRKYGDQKVQSLDHIGVNYEHDNGFTHITIPTLSYEHCLGDLVDFNIKTTGLQFTIGLKDEPLSRFVRLVSNLERSLASVHGGGYKVFLNSFEKSIMRNAINHDTSSLAPAPHESTLLTQSIQPQKVIAELTVTFVYKRIIPMNWGFEFLRVLISNRLGINTEQVIRVYPLSEENCTSTALITLGNERGNLVSYFAATIYISIQRDSWGLTNNALANSLNIDIDHFSGLKTFSIQDYF
jgi:hypothetical protein